MVRRPRENKTLKLAENPDKSAKRGIDEFYVEFHVEISQISNKSIAFNKSVSPESHFQLTHLRFERREKGCDYIKFPSDINI